MIFQGIDIEFHYKDFGAFTKNSIQVQNRIEWNLHQIPNGLYWGCLLNETFLWHFSYQTNIKGIRRTQ